MGTRFRKSVNLGGGVKMNVSKSGVGFSAGTKGARVTKTARGTTRTTLSVPGTGLSYVSETGKGGSRRRSSGGSASGEYDRMESVYALLDELEAKAAEAKPEDVPEQEPRRFCPQCGAKIAEDAMQCPRCRCRFDAPRAVDDSEGWTAKDVADVAKISMRIVLFLFMLMLCFVASGGWRIAALALTVTVLPIPAIDRLVPIHGWKRGLITALAFLAVMLVGVDGEAPDGTNEPVTVIETTTEATTEATTEPTTEVTEETVPETTEEEITEEYLAHIRELVAEHEATTPKEPKAQWALNTESGKFHRLSCHLVGDGAKWKMRYTAYTDMLDEGYSPCRVCFK